MMCILAAKCREYDEMRDLEIFHPEATSDPCAASIRAVHVIRLAGTPQVIRRGRARQEHATAALFVHLSAWWP
jgi:hypothetical protein